LISCEARVFVRLLVVIVTTRIQTVTEDIFLSAAKPSGF